MEFSFNLNIPPQILALIVAILIFTYIIIKSHYNFWKKRNIYNLQPNFFFGNFGSVFMLYENEAQLYDKLYQAMGNKDIAGSFYFWKPVLLIKNPELIKKICVKDFEHFCDHLGFSDFSSTDKVVFSLFTMRGSIWKDRRSKFVPNFSLKNIKSSFESVIDNCKLVVPLVENERGKDIELESLISRYTINIITNTLLGLKTDATENPNSTFLECGKLSTNPPLSTVFKIVLFTLFPKIYKALGLQTLSPKIFQTFSPLVKHILQFREENGIISNDIIGTLMQLKKERTDIPIEEMMGHIYSFFEAGYDSTTITTSYALYELSKSQSLQSRLREEIETAFVNGQLQYDALLSLPFLELVIKETLRMYPPSGVIKRECTKAYKIEGYTIPIGMPVIIPIHSLHHNPEFYTDPEVFNPERIFAVSAPYLPFGLGPRICIAMKLAELSVKVGLAIILKNFDVLPPKNHLQEVQFDPQTIFITVRPKNGIWVRMEKRNKPINTEHFK